MLADNAVTVRFTPTWRQLTRALRAINGAIPRIRMMRRISWAVLIVTLVLSVAGMLSFITAVTLFFIPGLMLFLLWTLPAYMAWLSYRNSPVWKSEHVFTFGPGGIDISTGTTSGHTAWAAVMRTAESSDFFLFFQSDQVARFVPKGGLSALDVETLREMFAARAGKGDASTAVAEAPIAADTAVQVSFEYDAREAARAGMVAARKSGTLWLPYTFMVLLVAWNTVPTAYRQWKRGGLENVSIPFVLLGLFPLILIIVGPPLAARWAAKREIRTGPAARGVQRVGVGDWGIQVAGPLYSGTLQWDALMKATETAEFFLFFVTRIQPVFIPKRLLSVVDLERVRALTRTGLGAKAELLDA